MAMLLYYSVLLPARRRDLPGHEGFNSPPFYPKRHTKSTVLHKNRNKNIISFVQNDTFIRSDNKPKRRKHRTPCQQSCAHVTIQRKEIARFFDKGVGGGTHKSRCRAGRITMPDIKVKNLTVTYIDKKKNETVAVRGLSARFPGAGRPRCSKRLPVSSPLTAIFTLTAGMPTRSPRGNAILPTSRRIMSYTRR